MSEFEEIGCTPKRKKDAIIECVIVFSSEVRKIAQSGTNPILSLLFLFLLLYFNTKFDHAS